MGNFIFCILGTNGLRRLRQYTWDCIEEIGRRSSAHATADFPASLLIFAVSFNLQKESFKRSKFKMKNWSILQGLRHDKVSRNLASRDIEMKFQRWALSVFLNFFNTKKWYFSNFYQVNNLFLHQSYKKSHLPVKLTW